MKIRNSILIVFSSISIFLLTACGGGTKGVDLLEFVTLEAGEQCAHGGVQVDSGADANDNDALDDDEITTSSVICNGAEGKKSLVATVKLDVGDESCPDGGTRFNHGIDNNGNGSLDEDEIVTTEAVCGGAAGMKSLVLTTSLPVHDVNCPGGGTRIQNGIDDNGNDELDDNEIRETQYVCQGEDALKAKSMEPPAGPAAQYTLNTSGGKGVGAGANGGAGGHMDVFFDRGSDTGHIKFFKTGQADASFAFPASINTYLGNNPLNVIADMTIKHYLPGDHTGAVTDEFHTHDLDSRLYKWDGAVDTAATGISVSTGATLIFELQNPVDLTAWIDVDNDIVNMGTITTTLKTDGISRGNLSIDCDTFYGAPGSLISLTGVADGVVGGSGGNFQLNAYKSNNEASYQGSGAFYNQGEINTSAGNGTTDGGSGGDVSISGELVTYNTAPFITSGGTGSSGNGGSAGYITLYSNYGSNYNSGALSAIGGSGTVNGRRGGSIYLYSDNLGDVRNSGNLSTNGGGGGTGPGGNAGAVEIYAYSGTVITSGNITNRGGDSESANGGDGGRFEVYTSYSDGWNIGDRIPPGDILISGNIDLGGGNGNTLTTGSGNGGNGGYVQVRQYPYRHPTGQEIVFLGYSEFILNGGDGELDGGDGGYLRAYQYYSEAPDSRDGPSGGVVNYVNVSANGGVGSNWFGGDGGSVTLETDSYYAYQANDWMVVKNYGDIQLDGGDGSEQGGSTGSVILWGYYGAENHGSITANGGSASSIHGTGGSSGNDYVCTNYCENGVHIVAAYGPAINTGVITAKGGSATDTNATISIGGSGSNVEIVGSRAENSANINVAGGDSLAGPSDSFGGDGGDVFIHGIHEGATNTATITANGGNGADGVGADGVIHVDAMNVTP